MRDIARFVALCLVGSALLSHVRQLKKACFALETPKIGS
jgi:hypothetical protein